MRRPRSRWRQTRRRAIGACCEAYAQTLRSEETDNDRGGSAMDVGTASEIQDGPGGVHQRGVPRFRSAWEGSAGSPAPVVISMGPVLESGRSPTSPTQRFSGSSPIQRNRASRAPGTGSSISRRAACSTSAIRSDAMRRGRQAEPAPADDRCFHERLRHPLQRDRNAGSAMTCPAELPQPWRETEYRLLFHRCILLHGGQDSPAVGTIPVPMKIQILGGVSAASSAKTGAEYTSR